MGNRVDPKRLKSVSMVEQSGGGIDAVKLVWRYAENLIRAERTRKNIERGWTRRPQHESGRENA